MPCPSLGTCPVPVGPLPSSPSSFHRRPARPPLPPPPLVILAAAKHLSFVPQPLKPPGFSPALLSPLANLCGSPLLVRSPTTSFRAQREISLNVAAGFTPPFPARATLHGSCSCRASARPPTTR